MAQAVPVVEGCPAFSKGCPFSVADLAAALPAVMGSMPATVIEKCPAFKGGCPFKANDSVESLYNALSEMPPTHRIGNGSPAAVAVERTFTLVHGQSKALSAKLNAQCPVFATSCPFKSVTSGGELLVQELDDIVDKWGLASETVNSTAPTEKVITTDVNEEPLSKALKAGTRSVHRAAENVRFVRDFLKCNVPKESYVELLKSLLHVYRALEDAIANLPAELRHCDFDALFRASALEADLRHYTATPEPLSLELGPPSPAARQYAERLQKLAVENPLLVLAHAYTRYLGDLSGGQILARAAAKSYDLSPGQGVAFYRFERVGSSAAEVKSFKRSYRASLDELRLSASDADALVEEANAAFLMNMLLFEERDVAAGHLARTRSLEEVFELVQSNSSALGFQRAYASQATSKCPFLPDSSAGPPARQTCPWPFVWLHAPHTALVSHPRKNAGGLFGLLALGFSAWHFPRSTGAGLMGAILVGAHIKPRKMPATKSAAPMPSGCPFAT